MDEIPQYTIKKQARFDAELMAAVPDAEMRAEIERGIRFALRHFPAQGVDTKRSSPFPVYAWPLRETPRHPGLVVYYNFGGKTVLLMSVRVADE